MTFTGCRYRRYFKGLMSMLNDLHNKNGYIAGYWDGVKDACCGKAEQWQSKNIMKLAVKAMGLSARAGNCLINSGCTYIGDVIQLSSCQIMRMRNLGPKTASEIAQWVMEHGILSTAWSEFI